jgi:ribose transport system substrate-binding protein
MKRIKLLLIILLAVSILASFGLQAQEKKWTICYNNFGQANFFARIGGQVGQNTIRLLGGEPIWTSTPSVEERITAIEDCIRRGADAIIIQEADIKMAAPALEEAKKKGIIIGSMDAGTAPFVDFVVESNNWVMGAEMACELVNRRLGSAKIVLIHNPLGQMIRMRAGALKLVLTEYPGSEIVADFIYAWPDFFPDIKSKMEAVLEAHPKPGEINSVFATFDGAGVAAAAAIREAGRQNEFIIVGIDGDPMAYEEMSKPDSPFVATAAQQPWLIAKTAVILAFDLLQGKGEELPIRHFYIPSKIVRKEKLPPVEEWPYPEVYANYPANEEELKEGVPEGIPIPQIP